MLSVARRMLPALLGGLLLAPADTGAQERVQETVVVTATVLPVPFDTLSRTVRVITREELSRLPMASVADAIRLAAGVDVRARGPHGVQTDFTVRGSNFSQVLVLVDGVRVNNSQTAHHNGDLPVTLDAIERIEVLFGPGSALYGADAFGGTINIITKRGQVPAAARLSVGQHGLVAGGGGVGFAAGGVRQQVSVSADRSSGFMFDRDFRTVSATARTEWGTRHAVTIGYADKAFGANGFYGNSPSKEWTNQFFSAFERRAPAADGGGVSVSASFRTHGDRFLWDITRPGMFENRHRTHAAAVTVKAVRELSAAWRLSGGMEQAADWIRSSNLGDHRLLHSGAFAEVQGTVAGRASMSGSVRFDYYSTFGQAWSPSIGASVWLSPTWRFRGSLSRAFRVPSFTERFYRDPAHRASADLRPERALGADVAVDWLPHPAWLATATYYERRERDVIDWVRASPGDVWETRNIRRVRTRGTEVGLRRTLGSGALVSIDYAFSDVAPEALQALSKYTLDYTRHALVFGGSAPLGGGIVAGGRLHLRQRTDRPSYLLADIRVARAIRGATVFVEGSNLLDVRYEEVRGVAMPGRWVRVGVDVTFR